MKITNQIALAHDAFTQFGGAERLFEAAHEIYPDAPVYTLVVDQSFRDRLKGWYIVTSPLQFIYNLYPKLTHLFIMIPTVLMFWRPNSERVLLSFSSSYIKGLSKPKGAVHINYCHTPPRFLWIDPEWALKEIPRPLHWLAKIFFSLQRQWDLAAAKKIDFFIANSTEVQKRIQQVYGRSSEVIFPFVDVNFWKPVIEKKDYFLIAGRLQYAKGLDTVVEAFNELGWPLHVAGTGRYSNYLKSIAKQNVKFLGYVTDEQLRSEYSGAIGYIYPQFEDFGMMPLEAAACGTASIGLAKGGSLETIIPGKTGELLETINKDTLIQALKYWDAMKYSQENLLTHSKQFSKEIFQQKIQAVVNRYL